VHYQYIYVVNVKRLAWEKHSSLFCYNCADKETKTIFLTLTPRVSAKNIFLSQPRQRANKLEYLSLAFKKLFCLRARPELSWVMHLIVPHP
jgi:hypothetical protein